MVKKSVRVSNRNANAEFVVSSVRTHDRAIARELAAIDAGLPDDKRLGEAAIHKMLTWLGTVLEGANHNLEQAEMAHVAEQADDPPVRDRRDVAAEAVASGLFKVRERISSTLGGEALATYGLQGETPRGAAAVAERAATVIRLLRENHRVVSDDIGGTVDTRVMADALASKYSPLKQALGEMAKETRELEATMLTRNTAVARWTDAYQGVANALTGLYRLAGRGDLAERVRPTSRRTSGDEPAPDPVGEPAGDLAGEPAGELAGDPDASAVAPAAPEDAAEPRP